MKLALIREQQRFACGVPRNRRPVDHANVCQAGAMRCFEFVL